MKQLNILIIVSIATACSTPRIYKSYSDWDINGNRSLDRHEFINAYEQSNYFDKWGSRKKSISYEEFYKKIFKSIDSDADEKINLVEFNRRMKPYYFGLFNESFSEWDTDSNSSIDRTEFHNKVYKTNISSLWDTSGDQRLSQRELAGGMFYISDTNNNNKVNELEFNIWEVNR